MGQFPAENGSLSRLSSCLAEDCCKNVCLDRIIGHRHYARKTAASQQRGRATAFPLSGGGGMQPIAGGTPLGSSQDGPQQCEQSRQVIPQRTFVRSVPIHRGFAAAWTAGMRSLRTKVRRRSNSYCLPIQLAMSAITTSATWPGVWYSAGVLFPRPPASMNRWLQVR